MTRRGELDYDAYEVPHPTVGAAETGESDDHASHAYLYLPDLSSQTRWSAHRVPERTERRERREMGFRR